MIMAQENTLLKAKEELQKIEETIRQGYCLSSAGLHLRVDLRRRK